SLRRAARDSASLDVDAELLEPRPRRVAEWAERSRTEWVDVDAIAPLGEVDVLPGRFRPADERAVGRHMRAVCDCGTDVPVLELRSVVAAGACGHLLLSRLH